MHNFMKLHNGEFSAFNTKNSAMSSDSIEQAPRLVTKRKPKRQLRWLEQWDLSNILLGHIDLSTSAATVSLPLVDLAVSPVLHIGLSTGYHSQSALEKGQAGNGWAIQNDLEFITLDHKGSVFSKDEEYTLTSHGQTFTFKRSNQGVYFIEGEDGIKINYDRANQRWITESPNIRSVYGRPESDDHISESIQWSLRWPHWRGPGRDESSLQREAVAWYLVSREENHGSKQKLYYEYIHEEKQLQRTNIGYTSVVLLKAIRDSNDNFQMDLRYGEKSTEEFTVKQYANTQGVMEFPLPLLSKYYFQGYLLDTPKYTQEIMFDYIIYNNNKFRLLTGLNQVFTKLDRNLSNEPLVHFDYGKNENVYLLQSISIPSYNSTVVYSYEKLTIPPLKFKTESLNTYRYPATDNVQIQQGVDCGVMSFDLGIGVVFVRIFNRHFTQYRQEISTCSSTKRLANYVLLDDDNSDGIKHFASILYPSILAVFTETGNKKALYIFHKTTNSTYFPDCPTSTFNFGLKTIFRYSDSLMVISENLAERPGSLFLVVPNKKDIAATSLQVDKGFTTTNVMLPGIITQDVQRMILQGDIILAYNGEKLYGIRRTDDGSWRTNVVALIDSTEHDILENKFYVPEEFRNSILPQIQSRGLHMVGNVVLLSTISYQSPPDYRALVTSCHLLLLDEALLLKRSLQHIVKRQAVYEMTIIDEQEDGNILHFGYNNEGKHKSFLKDITGTLDKDLEDQIKDSEKRQEAKDEILKEINRENEHTFREMILFDFVPFMKFSLDAKKATASNTTLEMMGNGWQTKQVSNASSFLLGSSFVMEFTENEKDLQVAYRLFRQNPSTGGTTGNSLSNFEISTNFGNLGYGYPAYIGVHSFATDPVYLLTLPEDGESCKNITIGDRGEQLLRLSNMENLYTIRNTTDPSLFPFDKEIIVRRVNSILSSSPLWTVSQTDISFGNQIRTRTFENIFISNDTSLSQTNILRITPMGNASSFGYYEEKTDVPIEAPENSTSAQIWYDNSGNVVLSELNPETPEDETNDGIWYQIFDIFGQREIVDVSPYNVTEKMVSHLGFENYENNTHPWRYNPGNVFSNSFPLTGQNVLRIRDTDRLQAVITPTRQHELIIASTWVRSAEIDDTDTNFTYNYGQPSGLFTAKLKTYQGFEVFMIKSQMKRQKGSWVYLELLIDLEGIRQNAYAELYRHSDELEELAPPSHTNFTIVLELNRGTKEFVDVDHIRFYPSQLDISSKVYDSGNGLETERILFDGEILRKLYDAYGKEIGTVGEGDQIENFRSGTLSGCIIFNNQTFRPQPEQFMKTEIIFQPEGGIYETFDAFSRRNIWQIEELDDETWTFFKGTMEHESNKSHKVFVKHPEQLFDLSSSAVRFYIDLHSTNSELAVSLHNLRNVLTFTYPGTLTVGENCSKVFGLPSLGEIIMHIEKQTALIWFDGVLIFDRRLNRECLPSSYNPTTAPWSEFNFNVTGQLYISQLITLRRPKITVEFLNAWGDRTQVLQLVNEDTVLVHETIYDELGRDAIKTKTAEIHRVDEFAPVLHYYPDLVTNRFP